MTNLEPLGEVTAINTQTGTTYTLALADKGKIVEMNNASANTLTIPTNASVAFPTAPASISCSMAQGLPR